MVSSFSALSHPKYDFMKASALAGNAMILSILYDLAGSSTAAEGTGFSWQPFYNFYFHRARYSL